MPPVANGEGETVAIDIQPRDASAVETGAHQEAHSKRDRAEEGDEEPSASSGVKDVLVVPTRLRYVAAVAAVTFLAAVFLGFVVGTFHSNSSALDVMLVMICHCAFVFYAMLVAPSMRSAPKYDTIGQYESLLVVLLTSSKCWLLGRMVAAGDTSDPYVVILAVAVAFIHTICFVAATRAATTEKVNLRWESAKVILRPYFVPDGHRNKIFVALTWFVLGMSKVCAITAPLVLGAIVTNLTSPDPSTGSIDPSIGLIAFYCALNLLPSVFSEMQDSLYVKVFQTAYAQVAEFTFRHVHSLSVEWHLQKKMGNVIRSLDRGMQGADSLMYNAMLFFIPAIVSALASLIVVAVHLGRPEIAAICYLGFGMYCWVTLVGTIVRQSFREEMNEHDNDMHDKASDSLVNFETVKCFTNEDHETQSYIHSVRSYQKKNFKDQAMMSLMNVSQSTMIQSAMMGAMMLAAYAVSRREAGFSAGEFITVQAYVLSIFTPLSFLGYIYSGMMNGITDIQNLSDLLAAEPDVIDAPNAIALTADTPLGAGAETVKQSGAVTIEFRHVSFHYPTASQTSGLHDVSFVVPCGTTTALVGPTGSGKTTISRLLFRFYDVLEGAVLMNGHDLRDCTQRSVRSLIGVVPQEAVLFNDTIRYNIRYGRLNATDAEVEDAARQAKIHDAIMRFEKGYDTICGERGLKLSGGEKQRLAIARCLLKNPPVVLLDEATSALDNKTERDVQEALACLEGRTTMIIAHRLSTIQRADQIIVMRDGRIDERGTHSELLAMGGLYSEMWNAQGSTDDAGSGTGTSSPAAVASPTTNSEPQHEKKS